MISSCFIYYLACHAQTKHSCSTCLVCFPSRRGWFGSSVSAMAYFIHDLWYIAAYLQYTSPSEAISFILLTCTVVVIEMSCAWDAFLSLLVRVQRFYGKLLHLVHRWWCSGAVSLSCVAHLSDSFFLTQLYHWVVCVPAAQRCRRPQLSWRICGATSTTHHRSLSPNISN